MKMKIFIVPVILLVVFSVNLNVATISPGDKNKSQQKQLKARKGPLADNVFERNLIDEEPSPKDIIVENGAYCKDTALRRFNGTILGYVTPWNNHGYDVAKTWGKKFDIISPVWLQITRSSDSIYRLGGAHDIDVGWMKDVKKSGKKDKKSLQILPRIIFDKFSEKDFSKLLTFDKDRRIINELIVKTCADYMFDGIILEIWSTLAARVDDDILYRLVIDMAEILKSNGLKFILVIPPFREEMHDLFGQKHFEKLYPHVTAFSLMTYDFSSLQRPGANAPLHWMRAAIEHIVPDTEDKFELKRSKILMGLNMYGMDYTPDGGGAIVGEQFLNLLKNMKKRLLFDEHDEENFFEIKTSTGRHIVFYPTLYSINKRIELAQELHVGVSIWELGQGLDYFYDLF